MGTERGSKMKIVMLPFVAHGHISPFYELANQLSKRNCTIFLCSTPANLSSIKNRLLLNDRHNHSINLIEFNLPSTPDLPPHHHTTNGLPSHLMLPLRSAFDAAGPTFSQILTTLDPDLFIYDFNPSWAPEVAAEHGIPAVYFLTTAAATGCVALHSFYKPGEEFPFPEIHVFDNNNNNNTNSEPPPADKMKLFNDFIACFRRSCDVILVKSFRELEGKYMDFLSELTEKKFVPVGPLVQVPVVDHKHDPKRDDIIKWLDKREESSVVFVCFGSEYFLSKEELEELACGLEISGVHFLWALRFVRGDQNVSLPYGFVERTGDRGLVVEGWAPQAWILGHSATGGFVSHCGWSSVTESMKFGVPVIAMPRHLDQPLNARLVAEVGVGMAVKRDGEGKCKRGEIAEVIRKVVVDKSREVFRRKAKELSEEMKDKGEEEIDVAVEELFKIYHKTKNAKV